MLENIIFVVVGILFLILIIDNIRIRLRYVELVSLSMQNIIDKNILENTVSKNIPVDQEGFIKFLNQSRDWAFEYIEKTQSTIQDFSKAFGPIANSLDKEDSDQAVKEALRAYRDLISILPDQDTGHGR